MNKNKMYYFKIALFVLILIHTNIISGQKKIDRIRLKRIDDVLVKHIEQNHIPGATALVIKGNKIIYSKSFGYADIENNVLLKQDHIFRIASQSKALTSLAAMILWEEGKFLLDDPVSKYFPAFANPRVLVSYTAGDGSYETEPAKREITIRDLLRHTSGIAYPAIFSDPTMWAIYEKGGVPSGIGTAQPSLQEAMNRLSTMPLQHQPGEAFTYGLNIDLLGYLIEIWSGQNLDIFMHERIFKSMGMNDTYFHVPPTKHKRVVPLYDYSATTSTIGKVKNLIYEGVDPNFPVLNGAYLSGGAGLSSTVNDLAKFYSIYLNNGKYLDKQIVSSKTIELMLLNQLGADIIVSPLPAQQENFEFSLGGFSIISDKNNYLSPLSTGSFGWGGAFNTHGWADPKEKMIAILFTQEYLSPYYSIGEEFQIALYQTLIKK